MVLARVRASVGMRSEDRATRTDEGKPPERIAHELGNLLAVTIGQSEYLLHEDGRETPEERRESLESVRRAALEAREKVRRLHRLIRDGGAASPGPPADPEPRAWQVLLSSALGAMAPGENLHIRLGKDDNGIVLDVSGRADSVLDALVGTAPGPVDLGKLPDGERTVRIHFPLPGTSSTPQGVARGSGSSVLVIDDQEEVRESLADLLRQLGHRVQTAAAGVDGIESYRRERVDCVVTDMGMPGISGLTVCRAIKDYDPGAYVVLLTGADYDGDPEELRAAGVDRLMVKPLSRGEVSGLVDRRSRRATDVTVGAAVQDRHE